MFLGLFDDDSWDEVPWYDKEDVDSDETSWHEERPSVKNNNNADCDRS